jgi:hypothetical protein
LRDREIYCDARGDGGSATAECREPASCDRLPVHRSESPTGYSSAGCSPAEPASASPVTDNSSSIPIRRGSQMRCSTSLQGCSPAFCCDRPVAPGTSAANGVSPLLCAPGISRRHQSRRDAQEHNMWIFRGVNEHTEVGFTTFAEAVTASGAATAWTVGPHAAPLPNWYR